MESAWQWWELMATAAVVALAAVLWLESCK